MFLSGVSAGLVLASGVGQAGRLGPREQQVWKRMEPAIATVLQNGKPMGAAALIDSSGLFVAHRNAVFADAVQGKMADGSTIQLTVRGQDVLTQLVLLQAANWEASRARPFSVPDGNEQAGSSLMAVLPSGPIRAEYVSARRYGVVKPSHRLVPLSEIRFEAPASEVGTALVFGDNGEFIGALNATLGAPQEVKSNPLSQNLNDPSRLNNILNHALKPDMGPSQLTVAYTTGAQVIKRVLNGFKSESHVVEYPSLGVMCTDAIGNGGALVQQVVPNSPAQVGGMRPGDVIVDIAGNPIRNQVDFARVMLEQEVGQKITIRIKRGKDLMFLNTVVAKAAE